EQSLEQNFLFLLWYSLLHNLHIFATEYFLPRSFCLTLDLNSSVLGPLLLAQVLEQNIPDLL
ncbi:MAG: hypothetical protein ACK5XN_31300, partial [Bacteroidota bacterium]